MSGRRGPWRLVVAALLATCAALAPSGCASDPREGYAWTSSFDDEVKTVNVSMFRNDTYTRDVEVLLTDAVIKEIQRSTPWRVTRADDADLALTGRITRSDLDALSTARTSGLVQELAVRLTVDFDLTDARSGDAIVSRRGFTASEVFVPSVGVGERLEVGEHAAVQELARELVAALRSNW